MNARVMFHSKTGNTKKVAQAMARELGCACEEIGSRTEGTGVDLLFIGAAVYATHDHGLDPKVLEFIRSLKSGAAKKVALFCTGFSAAAVSSMRNGLEARSIPVIAEFFHCEGRFLLFKHGHPDQADLEHAKAFAQMVAR